MSTQTAQAPSTAQSVWLVAEREIGSKIRSKAFLISTIILFLGALALVVWGGIQAGSTSGTPVAVTADAQQYVADVPGLEVTDAADRAEAEALGQAAALVGVGHYGLPRPAHERLDRLLRRHRHADLGQQPREHAVGDRLGVDQDPVAVEDDGADQRTRTAGPFSSWYRSR